MHTINPNAVRGCSYEKFFTRKFIIRKFLCTKISRSTVVHKLSRRGRLEHIIITLTVFVSTHSRRVKVLLIQLWCGNYFKEVMTSNLHTNAQYHRKEILLMDSIHKLYISYYTIKQHFYAWDLHVFMRIMRVKHQSHKFVPHNFLLCHMGQIIHETLECINKNHKFIERPILTNSLFSRA